MRARTTKTSATDAYPLPSWIAVTGDVPFTTASPIGNWKAHGQQQSVHSVATESQTVTRQGRVTENSNGSR